MGLLWTKTTTSVEFQEKKQPLSCPVLGKGTKNSFKDRTFLPPLHQKITCGKTHLRTRDTCPKHFFCQHCPVCVSNGRMMEANCSEFSFRSWIQLKLK